MAKPTKTAPKRTNKSKTKKGKLDFLTNRINFKSRKTQFILTILVFALVGGAWFTYKSFAATETTYSNGAIHDGWKYSYASFTSPPKAEENLYISSKLQAQFPVECKNGMISLPGSKNAQTWNANKTVFFCSSETTETAGIKQNVISMISVGYDGSNPQIIKKDNNIVNGSFVQSGARSIFTQAFIKDGSMSKIAFVESIGYGTYANYNVGIYDVATKNTTYIKDSNGFKIDAYYASAIDWSPDGTKLKYVKNDFQVCTVSVNGGSPQCESPGLKYPGGTIQSDNTLFSYDLDTVYFRTTDSSRKGTVYSYKSSTKEYKKLLVDSGAYDDPKSELYLPKLMSPDSRYILIYKSTSSTYYVYDTVDMALKNTTIPVVSANVFWQANKVVPSTPVSSKNNTPAPAPAPSK